MRSIFSFLLLVFISSNLFSQIFDRAKMDSLFSRIEKNQEGMGSVSIFKNGEEAYQNAIGFVDVENKIKANQSTKYRIGSISKTFTATLIMQLVEEGKLDLNTELSKFYPKIPNAEKITIEHLLRHQSGLFNFTSDPAYVSYMESPKTKMELLEIFKAAEPVFLPGSKAKYSNTNYVLLTFIIEDVTGKKYSEVLRKRITEPLNLKNTYYGGKINPEKNEALSYHKMMGWQQATETDMSIPRGAGGIVSTPTDLNRFFSALFTGKLLEKATFEKMKTIQKGFGIGLFELPFNDKTALGHNGGIDGFQSVAEYFPKHKVAVSYISNGSVMAVSDIMTGVLRIYFGKDYELPNFDQNYQVSEEDLKQYLGVYGSETFPLKITISQEGKTLMAQATGQMAFPMEPYAKHKFKFDAAGIKIEFIPSENKLILMQGGGRFEFMRE